MVKILRFPSTAGFKKYKAFFSKESVSHPAKINLKLLEWIIKTYTSPGDVVVDPMAGTFSTPILASLLGRDGVGVDLESRFVKMGLENKTLTDKQTSLSKKGTITVLQGDARELSKLLGVADNIITSPPYSDLRLKAKSGLHRRNLILQAIKRGDKISDRVRSWVKNFDKQKDMFAQDKYDKKPDVIISSPPYSEGTGHGRGKDKKLVREKGIYLHGQDAYVNPIDVVVTSPPYSDTVRSGREGSPRFDELMREKGSMGGSSKSIGLGYSKAKENIGNLKGETYLTAMRKVYDESFKVLKPNGKMVLVVKNFIRNKKVVNLAQDTIELCISVGFKLVDHVLFKLPIQSFWRILYKKKHPEVDVSGVEHEHILVFKKIGESVEK